MAMQAISGWLTPQGEFIPCGYREHGVIAEQIIEQNNLREEIEKSNEFEERYLQTTYQYYAFGFNGFGDTVVDSWIAGNWNQPPTEAQMKWLREHFEEMALYQKMTVNIHIFQRWS